MRILLTIGLGATIVTTLSGCMFLPFDPPAHDPIAIRFEGETLLIVPCETLNATDILMETRGPDTDDEWVPFFDVTGRVSVHGGDEFSTAEDAAPIEGMTTRFSPTLPPGTEISMLFADNSRPYSSSNYFEIGEDGVPQDGWLQWDGTITDEPCGYHAER